MATETDGRARDGIAGYGPGEDRPVVSYGVLMAGFVGVSAAFSGWVARSNRELPEQLSSRDLALITVATHKASRLLAKDRVTSAVRAPFTRFEEEGGPGESRRKHAVVACSARSASS